MLNNKHHLTLAQKRKIRVRAKLFGTQVRPRVCVHRSNKYCYIQVINDESGKVIVQSNDVKLRKDAVQKKVALTKTQSVVQATQELLAELQKAKVQAVVFDRGQYKYHGRVKAVAQTLRDGGIRV